MGIASKLIYNVGLLLIMMLPGVILKKTKLSSDGLGKGLSNLVLFIAQPALVFVAYLKPYDPDILINALYVLLFSIVAHVIFSVVALLSYKSAPDSVRRMLRFATIFSNAAFMGIPLIAAVLGDAAIIYASIYNITFNLFLWSLGVYICTDEDGETDDVGRFLKKAILKALVHPVMLAAVLGLVFFFLPIHDDIPEIIVEALTMLKQLVAPLSMVVLGLRLADMNLKGFFTNKHLYVFVALRHFLLPAAVFAVMRIFSLFVSLDGDVIKSVLIMASAPAATSATMFAEKYDCDADYVSKLVAVSTILSLATMPIVILLTNI